jgi:ATP-binding cassette subfamily B protein
MTIGSLIAAIISVVSFNANLATAFLIFNYTASIVSQLFIFSNQALRNYSRAFGDASEMVEIMSLEPEVKDPINPEKLLSSGGKIEFKNVTFSHNGSSSAIFEDFSLDIKDGEKIGLVGHSGAGKTTFTSLLLRFSDIDSGEILIGGQNIATITQKDLHSLISYVPQEPLLFHRSIKENIAYGDPRANFEKVINASKQAHADEFIRQIPTSYDTLVGERGVKLSGGQRQRIAIARAMLRQSPVLVLDEATSALDSESEVLIQDALWKLMAGRTAIVIAHRLSTIQKMDRILVMSDGKIVEQGTHHQLLELNGSYAKLWAHQSGGFLED